jgi:hypothetical protein
MSVAPHPVAKGDASEKVWLTLLQNYLPQRYQAATAYVVDSVGKFSDQIDVVVFDRQYSPFIFLYEGQNHHSGRERLRSVRSQAGDHQSQ